MSQDEVEDAAQDREATELERHARTQGRPLLSRLTVGDKVRAWSKVTKKFSDVWRIIDLRQSGRSYTLKDEVSGRVYVRNRRWLFPMEQETPVAICFSGTPPAA